MVPAYLKAQAALARAARKATLVSSSDPDSSESDNCHWDGTEGNKVPQFFQPFIHHSVPDPKSDTEWQCEDGPLLSDDESSESDEDLVGQDLLRSFALAGNSLHRNCVRGHNRIQVKKRLVRRTKFAAPQAERRRIHTAQARKWEHRMIRWMDAYRSDLGPKEAQQFVRAFSSTRYKSHRRVSEAMGQRLDQ
ncbi:hypothetical protein B0H13DRAFT_2345856 [Mycena leptocephala]|nr:hypothetical protein B0H13DRAFT_2345856 [Mycena leptocephala]